MASSSSGNSLHTLSLEQALTADDAHVVASAHVVSVSQRLPAQLRRSRTGMTRVMLGSKERRRRATMHAALGALRRQTSGSPPSAALTTTATLLSVLPPGAKKMRPMRPLSQCVVIALGAFTSDSSAVAAT